MSEFGAGLAQGGAQGFSAGQQRQQENNRIFHQINQHREALAHSERMARETDMAANRRMLQQDASRAAEAKKERDFKREQADLDAEERATARVLEDERFEVERRQKRDEFKEKKRATDATIAYQKGLTASGKRKDIIASGNAIRDLVDKAAERRHRDEMVELTKDTTFTERVDRTTAVQEERMLAAAEKLGAPMEDLTAAYMALGFAEKVGQAPPAIIAQILLATPEQFPPGKAKALAEDMKALAEASRGRGNMDVLLEAIESGESAKVAAASDFFNMRQKFDEAIGVARNVQMDQDARQKAADLAGVLLRRMEQRVTSLQSVGSLLKKAGLGKSGDPPPLGARTPPKFDDPIAPLDKKSPDQVLAPLMKVIGGDRTPFVDAWNEAHRTNKSASPGSVALHYNKGKGKEYAYVNADGRVDALPTLEEMNKGRGRRHYQQRGFVMPLLKASDPDGLHVFYREHLMEPSDTTELLQKAVDRGVVPHVRSRANVRSAVAHFYLRWQAQRLAEENMGEYYGDHAGILDLPERWDR